MSCVGGQVAPVRSLFEALWCFQPTISENAEAIQGVPVVVLSGQSIPSDSFGHVVGAALLVTAQSVQFIRETLVGRCEGNGWTEQSSHERRDMVRSDSQGSRAGCSTKQ